MAHEWMLPACLSYAGLFGLGMYFQRVERKKRVEFLTKVFNSAPQLEQGPVVIDGLSISKDTKLIDYTVVITLPLIISITYSSRFALVGTPESKRLGFICTVATMLLGWLGIFGFFWTLHALMELASGSRSVRTVSTLLNEFLYQKHLQVSTIEQSGEVEQSAASSTGGTLVVSYPGIYNRLATASVHVDNKCLGMIAPTETLTVPLEPGVRKVWVKRLWLKSKALELSFSPGQVVHLQCSQTGLQNGLILLILVGLAAAFFVEGPYAPVAWFIVALPWLSMVGLAFLPGAIYSLTPYQEKPAASPSKALSGSHDQSAQVKSVKPEQCGTVQVIGKGTFNRAQKYMVYVNDALTGSLLPSEKLNITVPEGTQKIFVKLAWFKSKPVEIVVPAGQLIKLECGRYPALPYVIGLGAMYGIGSGMVDVYHQPGSFLMFGAVGLAIGMLANSFRAGTTCYLKETQPPLPKISKH